MGLSIDLLCRAAAQENAVDLFLQEEEIPRVRMKGKIMNLGDEVLAAAEMIRFWEQCGVDAKVVRDKDVSYTAADGTRYRVNLHRQLGKRGAVLRPVKSVVPEMEELGLPADYLAGWLGRSSGMILVAGATGMGKSTTVASVLRRMNMNYTRHVVTIEDPVEFLLRDENCIFTQREVGTDTDSFEQGLKSSLRQSPDVIFLGELLEAVPASVALQAAETGHLVLTTLHSAAVGETIERMVNFFPSASHGSILHVLAEQLVGVFCQKLLPGTDGEPVLVAEYFQNEGATKDWIRNGEFKKIEDFISRGGSAQAKSFLSSIVEAVEANRITVATAEEFYDDAIELQRAMRGISGGNVTV